MRFAGNVGDEVVVLKDGSSRLEKDTKGIVTERKSLLVLVRITEGPLKGKMLNPFDVHVKAVHKETQS
jgi:hypothetical protein